ncbi:unnamed protein product [Paramecium sonneborni]|uniref:HTH CENPB-type domain-containing protein n=1 Tax=Paramecium sonneborni TaxID=65129 RepID=A0A8S1KYV7_9CILI|nr:unnamed protein product [Paramecium sonneborni]
MVQQIVQSNKLENWILGKTRKEERKLNRDEIKQKAQELINEESFIASRGWIKQFIQNNDIDFKVREILFENGILSEQQAQKFQQEKAKRKESNNNDNQETISKQEQIEQLLKIQTSEFNQSKDYLRNDFDDGGYLEYQDCLVDYDDSHQYL